jgi:hypothetical protein
MMMNAVHSFFMAHCAIYIHTDDHHSMSNISAYGSGMRLSKSIYLVFAILKPECFMSFLVFIWVSLLTQFLGPQ